MIFSLFLCVVSDAMDLNGHIMVSTYFRFPGKKLNHLFKASGNLSKKLRVTVVPEITHTVGNEIFCMVYSVCSNVLAGVK